MKYWAVEPGVYRTFDFPGADDMGNMFQFKHDCNAYHCSVRDLDNTRALNPELKTFRAWLKGNASRIPVPVATS